MIIHDIEQKTSEWFELRAGKITASIASKLITPTGKISTQYKAELGRILAEKLGLQEPETSIETYWMSQGIVLEEEARNWLAVDMDVDPTQVGFISSEDGLAGVSPDAVFYDKGKLIPVEIKCPKPSNHIKWYLEGVLPDEHVAQVHFAMAITGAPYAIFMSYNPALVPLIIRVERSEYTESLLKFLEIFKQEYKDAYLKIKGVSYEP